MKHKAETHKFEDIFNYMSPDCHARWREVMGVNDEECEGLAELCKHGSWGDDNNPDEQQACDDLAEAEDRLFDSLRGTMWEISWPEHVVNPRFNSDASYRRV